MFTSKQALSVISVGMFVAATDVLVYPTTFSCYIEPSFSDLAEARRRQDGRVDTQKEESGHRTVRLALQALAGEAVGPSDHPCRINCTSTAPGCPTSSCSAPPSIRSAPPPPHHQQAAPLINTHHPTRCLSAWCDNIQIDGVVKFVASGRAGPGLGGKEVNVSYKLGSHTVERS